MHNCAVFLISAGFSSPRKFVNIDIFFSHFRNRCSTSTPVYVSYTPRHTLLATLHTLLRKYRLANSFLPCWLQLARATQLVSYYKLQKYARTSNLCADVQEDSSSICTKRVCSPYNCAGYLLIGSRIKKPWSISLIWYTVQRNI